METPSPRQILLGSSEQLNDRCLLMWELFRAEFGKLRCQAKSAPFPPVFVWAAAENGFHIFQWLEKNQKKNYVL